MIPWSDLAIAAPIGLTALGGLVVLLLTVAGGPGRPAPESGAHLTVASLGSLVGAAWLLSGVSGSTLAFSGALVADGLAATFGMVVVLAATAAVLLAHSYLERMGMSLGEFLALVLLSTSGMLTLVMAGDLMTLFIGIETMSIAAYVLSGYRRSSRRSQEAAMKYFVYGAYASGFVLFGLALVYGEVGRLTGTPGVRLTAIGAAFAGEVSALGWAGVAMLIGGFGFKIAAAPFHMWAPDVYEGAPTPATGFMAGGIKAAGFAGLCRFVAAVFLPAGVASESSIQLFEVLAIVSMVFGNLVAIRQRTLKRMLAYSSVAHAGYVLVGVAAYLANPDGRALAGITYYLLGYAAMTLGAFGVVLAVERADDRTMDLAVDRLGGLGVRHPGLALAMTVFMFSLAGVPPTAGFFGKLSLFAAAVEAGRTPVVIVAVVASAIGAYYYLRVLVAMYMGPATTEALERIRSPWLAAGLWLCLAVTVGSGLLPELYFAYAQRVLSAPA